MHMLFLLMISRMPNYQLNLEKKGARLFSMKEVEKSLEINKAEVSMKLMMDEKELMELTRLPRKRIIEQMENINFPADISAIKKKNLKSFLHSTYKNDIKNLSLLRTDVIYKELGARDLLPKTEKLIKLKGKLKKEFLKEDKIRKDEKMALIKLKKTIYKKTQKMEIKLMLLKEIGKSIISTIENNFPDELHKSLKQFKDIFSGPLNNNHNEKEIETHNVALKLICFKLELFYAACVRAREEFICRFITADCLEEFFGQDAYAKIDPSFKSFMAHVDYLPIKREHLFDIKAERIDQILKFVGTPNIYIKLPVEGPKRDVMFALLLFKFHEILKNVLINELKILGLGGLNGGFNKAFKSIESVFEKTNSK